VMIFGRIRVYRYLSKTDQDKQKFEKWVFGYKKTGPIYTKIQVFGAADGAAGKLVREGGCHSRDRWQFINH